MRRATESCDLSERPQVSIVVPILNERSALVQFCHQVQTRADSALEWILVDGGSGDGTLECLIQWAADSSSAQLKVHLVQSEPGRAQQMNAGAAVARGEWLLFLHVDTRLPEGDLTTMLSPAPLWGRFDVMLDARGFMFRIIARCINLRSRWSGIATGDQAIFVRRAVFERMHGYSPMPLMEDIELCTRLRACAKPHCLRARVVTSARRWQANGVWRTICLMWWLRGRYWLGASPQALAKAYRR